MKITDTVSLFDEEGKEYPTVVTLVYDEEGYDEDFISLFDVESNTNNDMGIYLFFHSDEFGKDYILFGDFASKANLLTLALNGEKFELVESDEEWDMIEEVMAAMDDYQEENGYES